MLEKKVALFFLVKSRAAKIKINVARRAL